MRLVCVLQYIHFPHRGGELTASPLGDRDKTPTAATTFIAHRDSGESVHAEPDRRLFLVLPADNMIMYVSPLGGSYLLCQTHTPSRRSQAQKTPFGTKPPPQTTERKAGSSPVGRVDSVSDTEPRLGGCSFFPALVPSGALR